ncbi:hypothetical protein O6H91_10G024300 [Diphasiastrum complanatum]|uniref:Uncharacterized protein n=5 Tax=Diphasiastrum complanatum TaxID=34168 RepID=A0ACC2CF54_DIPCM|nr:hypothetical protein O6H91_10G021900 [Diphasiastrum complanatum]KAJ7540564.1 hypothetical protein O6H91_10G021900 [Diphasiastrum complanatum]KAJ7540645.1 hypothetical protein O6H91_10G024300 [Diphasiastrum complanatum]KAJ7540647.1 hypothetical protein O6H91_10G024300 [Diphasiastrum complanatum]
MDNVSQDKSVEGSINLGERATSDVVVRLRTGDGRDEWFYCHSQVLCPKSKYFAARLSDDWPTCHLLDSRNCIELVLPESEVDYYVTLLRLLYVGDVLIMDALHSVKKALGILKVAMKLECDDIVANCVQYLEAVPWEETEEEEILKTLPSLGPNVLPVLARLQPVDADSVRNVFISALRVATTSAEKCFAFDGSSTRDLKVSAQEQVEYMLAEDDDAPLLVADDYMKSEFKTYFFELFESFKSELSSLLSIEAIEHEIFEDAVLEKVSDLLWVSRILPKVGLLNELVSIWSQSSTDLISVLQSSKLSAVFWDTKLKVVELASKVLDAVGFGTSIIPADQRTHLVKSWLPYIRDIKPLLDSQFSDGKTTLTMDAELCQNIESAFVSLILALPSCEQADILADWLQTEQTRYPDLTEAFEVWCFRSKAARRRLSSELNGLGNVTLPTSGCKNLFV